MKPPRDAEPLAQHQIAIVVARQRHAHPAGRDPRVADRAGDLQRHVLLARPGVGVDRAGIDPAVAGVDHHQREIRIARDARQRRALHRRDGDRDLVFRARPEMEEAQRPRAARLREPARAGTLQRQFQRVPRVAEHATRHHHRPREIEHDARPVAAAPALADRAHRAVPVQRRAGPRAVDIDRDPARPVEQEARRPRHRLVEMDQHARAVDLDALDGPGIGGVGGQRQRERGRHGGTAPPPSAAIGMPPRHPPYALAALFHAPFRGQFVTKTVLSQINRGLTASRAFCGKTFRLMRDKSGASHHLDRKGAFISRALSAHRPSAFRRGRAYRLTFDNAASFPTAEPPGLRRRRGFGLVRGRCALGCGADEGDFTNNPRGRADFRPAIARPSHERAARRRACAETIQ